MKEYKIIKNNKKTYFIFFIFIFFIFAPLYSQVKNEDFLKRRLDLEKIEKSTKTEIEIEKYFKDEDPIIREKTAKILASRKSIKARDILIKNLNNKDENVRLATINSLGEFKNDKKVINALINLKTNDKNTKWAIVEVLGNMKDNLSVDFLFKTFQKEKDIDIKKSVINSLGKIGNKKAITYLNTIKNGENKEYSLWASNVLKAINEDKKRKEKKKLKL